MQVTQQRVALVTGGTAGIGRAIAEALLEGGKTVVVTGRDRDKGARVVEELRAHGDAHFLPVDVLEQQQVEGLIDELLARFGRLDILVNNAGGSSGFAPIHELSDEAWAQALTWNVSSAFWACRRTLPAMMAEGFGRIINISSVQGKRVNRPNAGHYVTAKHAINGFTKAVAFEYGQHGITCNALVVGAVETDLMRTAGARAATAAGITYEEYKQRYADQALTGKLNTVEEVAAMAALLAADVSAGITGALINVDGGTCPY